MNLPVKMRAYSILQRLKHYRSVIDKDARLEGPLALIALKENETPIGIYENPHLIPSEYILISNFGLYTVNSAHSDFTLFSDIEAVEIPQKLGDSFVLYLTTYDQRRILINVGAVRIADAFEFMRFIVRVLNDLKEEPHQIK
ncbi:MAG: hypothetical protein SGI71_13390 [Verrucomicrobiota bacterium]|nr:hypothetical protein [Verrucomicrobiota bacterium]